MNKSKKLTFMEILAGAAKPFPDLWHDSGALNFKALEAHYARRGHPISQPTFLRIASGENGPGPKVITATSQVFGIPSAMLRGEAMAHETENLLLDYNVSTLLLAKRIENLPKADYQQIVDLLRSFEDKEAQLRHAMAYSNNVSQIDPKKR